MLFKKKDLPSFMRMCELKKYDADGKLHYISYNGMVAGFYVLDNTQFKNLYIKSQFRGRGLASAIITNEMQKQQITIATTKRMCGIKRIITKLGFKNTGLVVQGKQSLLEIWASPTEK